MSGRPRAAGGERVRAVLLDAFDTLVELEPPAPHLRARLLALTGVDVGEQAAQRAIGAEIRHYLEHHMRGRDRATLEALRDDCAAVLHEALGFERLELHERVEHVEQNGPDGAAPGGAQPDR